jgi:chromate reductase, NAD(P)H dehydrogenase (quinone)
MTARLSAAVPIRARRRGGRGHQRPVRYKAFVRILALGGSLRRASFNRALLDEAAALAPAGIELDLAVVELVGALPLFDQDILDGDGPPAQALALKNALRAADGLLIATPEYNWSIPGFLKNAIDWASRPSSDIPGVFGDLPVALIGAGGSAGTRLAQSAWLPVFRYLRMRPWAERTLYVDRARERFDADGRLADEATREQLSAVVAGFAAHCATLPRTRAG